MNEEDVEDIIKNLIKVYETRLKEEEDYLVKVIQKSKLSEEEENSNIETDNGN